jgi:hypothetical protein
MAKLFFSYSHKDEVLRDTLQTHLEMLRRSGAIETRHDRMIRAGDELDGAIDRNMEDADVILLLVSSDFLASSYCFDVEVKRAMERHEAGTARVIPVILRPCDWQEDTPFKKLLAAPKDGRPITKWPNEDEAFLDVVKQIRAALKTLPTPPPQPKAVSGFDDPMETFQQVFPPRSSNLRLHKNFSQADKDRFMDDAFEFMAKFFEASLDELKKRHPEIDVRYARTSEAARLRARCCGHLRRAGKGTFGSAETRGETPPPRELTRRRFSFPARPRRRGLAAARQIRGRRTCR